MTLVYYAGKNNYAPQRIGTTQVFYTTQVIYLYYCVKLIEFRPNPKSKFCIIIVNRYNLYTQLKLLTVITMITLQLGI